MKKYIVPTLNLIIMSSLFTYLSIRDRTLTNGILCIAGTLFFYGFIVWNLKKGINEIKVSTLNQIMSLLSLALLTGTLYEVISGNFITEGTGNMMAYILTIAGLLIWAYNYYIKPFIKFHYKERSEITHE